MNIYEKILELKGENKSFVLVSVVKTAGSTPGKTGFKMAVDSSLNSFGTVGGGAIEKEAIAEAGRILNAGEGNYLKEYLLNKDENIAEGNTTVIPMSCCGKITLFYELEQEASTIYIFGGGHVGSALAGMVKGLKFNTVLIDDRPDVIEKCRSLYPNTVLSSYKEYAEKFIPGADSYFVILTYGHLFDYDVLSTLYRRGLVKKYCGVIASKRKAKEMTGMLQEELGGNADLSLLHTPIGIKLGGDSAHEIALSIAAQIQSVKYGKKITAE